MKKRVFGYVLWMILAGCLYFFENNAGTRIVLVSSLLLPLFPAIRRQAPVPKSGGKERKQETRQVPAFSHQEEEEPGDVRGYLPGDPVNRIHWKLSAKRDELLIRESARGNASAESRREKADGEAAAVGHPKRKLLERLAAAVLLLSLILLVLVPEARGGAQALLNRLFEASERVNSYAYDRFPVQEGQSAAAAVLLLSAALLALLILTLISGSGTLAFSIMAVCAASQAYFGLSFPPWVQVPLFSCFAVWMPARPRDWKKAAAVLGLIASVSLAVTIFLPGVNGTVESASEDARDWLSRTAQQITGTVRELPAGEDETRHAHTQSLVSGDQEARPEREYRLITEEEEQISIPHWIEWLRIILLLLLSVVLLILPFLPFLALNARERRTRETREAFRSERISEAVCAIFQHVIAWLEAEEYGAGNLPYMLWSERFRPDVPENYAGLFAQCAEIFEEAAYSDHPLTEEDRRKALKLLEETEAWLLAKADWKEKLRLKYGKCLYL